MKPVISSDISRQSKTLNIEQQAPPKRRKCFTNQHEVISQKTILGLSQSLRRW